MTIMPRLVFVATLFVMMVSWKTQAAVIDTTTVTDPPLSQVNKIIQASIQQITANLQQSIASIQSQIQSSSGILIQFRDEILRRIRNVFRERLGYYN